MCASQAQCSSSRFNSRTREGCDLVLVIACLNSGSFNSRTREGCDLARRLDNVTIEFQFTHPGGVRLQTIHSVAEPSMFQFTHPGGVRPAGDLRAGEGATRFNSRTREGCDLSELTALGVTEEFQFTHPGGVRRLIGRATLLRQEFQFTHPGGVRP